jgi:Carboxypeptidase regulatory-like domain
MKAVAKVTVAVLVVMAVGIGIVANQGTIPHGSMAGTALVTGGPQARPRPVVGAEIVVTSSTPFWKVTTRTNRIGQFSVTLQPGRYQLRYEIRGWSQVCQSIPVLIRAGRTTVANCTISIV